MTTRRTFLALSAAAAALGMLGLPPAARAQTAAQATAFIKQTGDALVAIANGPGSAEQRKQQLAAVIERTVDVDGIGRFCLGRYARTATPQQAAEFGQLFHAVLATNITGHLGEYRGVAFAINRTSQAEGNVAVDTTVTRPNTAPADVQWVVGLVGGQPKILDVIAEGTSLRLTQRSDYNSFVTRNGGSVQALIDALRRQAG